MPLSISLLFLSCMLGSVSLEAPYVWNVGYPFKSADDPSTPENDVELYGVLWGGSSDGTDSSHLKLSRGHPVDDRYSFEQRLHPRPS